MLKIKKIASGEEITVTSEPIWHDGVWECGNRRFVDPEQLEYKVVISDPVYPIVSPVEFKLLWTPAERIAIKTLKASDPVIADVYEILDDPRLTCVNLSLASTQQGIDYVLAKLVEEDVITADAVPTRRAAILSGVFL